MFIRLTKELILFIEKWIGLANKFKIDWKNDKKGLYL